MSDLLSAIESKLEAGHQDKSGLSPDEQFQFLKSKTHLMLPEDVVLERLRRSAAEKRPLKIKLGVDPTHTDLHFGHAVPLMLLRRFQDLGHHAILIVGDFTAQIGDPAGRVDERPTLTRDQIEENFRTYASQAGKIVDLDRVEIRNNSEWLDDVKLPDLLRTLKGVNLSASLQRDDFRKRIEQGYSLTLAEVLYSVLMGLDSVALECDIEIGGIDQLLNLQMCRTVMESHGQVAEAIVCTDILEGVTGDGSKMSKSLGNSISLRDKPEDVYGKTMSIPDALLDSYFRLLTELGSTEREELDEAVRSGKAHPRDAKAMLARYLVSVVHDREAAAEAERHFDSVFRKRDAPDDMPEIGLAPGDWGALSWIDVLDRGGVVPSRSEARRLLQQGAVRFRGVEEEEFAKVEGDVLPAEPAELVLKIGKRKFLRLRNSGV